MESKGVVDVGIVLVWSRNEYVVWYEIWKF